MHVGVFKRLKHFIGFFISVILIFGGTSLPVYYFWRLYLIIISLYIF